MATTKTGVVRWFNDDRGYGFMSNSEGEDVLVHFSVIPGRNGKRSLEAGDSVVYIEEETEDGLRAKQIVSFTRGVK